MYKHNNCRLGFAISGLIITVVPEMHLGPRLFIHSHINVVTPAGQLGVVEASRRTGGKQRR
jgi:hypothetical protein